MVIKFKVEKVVIKFFLLVVVLRFGEEGWGCFFGYVWVGNNS